MFLQSGGVGTRFSNGVMQEKHRWAETEKSVMTSLKAGIIGCGWFGRVHLERLGELADVYVTALSDPVAEAANTLAAKALPSQIDPQAGKVAVYTDYRELLQHPDLDFVVIASPNKWHVEQILAALAQGLHILCEKPLTLVSEEVAQVHDAMTAAGKRVAVAYQSRYRRTARLLKHALDSGKWGRVTAVNIFACEDWVTPNVGTWRHDPERCPGGYFGDANGHQLDLLFWLTGLQAKTVHAQMDNCGTRVPLMTWGHAALTPQIGEGSDVPLLFHFIGTAHHWHEEIVLQTERADFLIRDTVVHWTDGSKPLSPLTEADLDLTEPLTDDTPDSAFVATLRGESLIVSEPLSVRPVMEFTLSALASAQK
jgi:predicted dehydrogenase